MELKVKGTKILAKILRAKTRFVVLQGGARSSKTHSSCQAFIIKLLKEKNKTLTIARKTMPALRATAMRDFFDILKEYNLYHPENHNKSVHNFVIQQIFFRPSSNRSFRVWFSTHPEASRPLCL